MRFRMPKIKVNRRDLVTTLSMLTLSAVVVYVLVSQSALNERQRLQYESLTATYEQLYDETVDAGVDPEAPPPEDIPPADSPTPVPQPSPGATGPAGPQGPGPTAAQVEAAVAIYCADQGKPCRPTMAQVAQALADYCAQTDCVGDDGANGVDGQNGEPGRPPTADEIFAALVAYCEIQPNGTCVGPAGKDGANGENATLEQIRTVVDEMCSTMPGGSCEGAEGPAGQDGKFVAGDYTCPDETPYMRGFSVQENGDWSVKCGEFPPTAIPTPES